MDEKQSLEVKLRGKDRDAINQIAQEAAIRSRPLWNRNLHFLDMIDVTATRSDGGLVSFPLSKLSHVTSQQNQKEGWQEDPDKPTDPDDLPAILHFENGDLIVLRDSFREWVRRLGEARYRAMQNLNKYIDIA